MSKSEDNSGAQSWGSQTLFPSLLWCPSSGWSQRGQVVIIVVVVEVIRVMGTATVIIVIWLLGTATFVVRVSSSISVVVGWGSRFEPQVRVWLLLEHEPAKRFRFRYSAKPDSQTPGSKSGSDRVWKVREPDCGQSRPLSQNLVGKWMNKKMMKTKVHLGENTATGHEWTAMSWNGHNWNSNT